MFMGIYWKPDKASKGDATEKKHEKWIKVSSMSFSSGRGIRDKVGRGHDRLVSSGHISELTITKDMDTASMNLFKGVCVGHGEKMEIHVTRAGTLDDKSEVVYLKYVLEDALITGYSFNSSGGKPTETLTINFSKITMTHTPQSRTAEAAQPITVSADAAATTAQGA
jgi:type VI secretion system secreted protein Hcp